MRAIVQDRYGPPGELRVADVPEPRPGEREVLVRVRATSLHPDVWHVVRGRPRVLRLMGAGLRRPRQVVPGIDVAGVVEAVGPGVTHLRQGDEVFGETVAGLQWVNGGALAERVAAPESALVHRPPEITPEQAAALATPGIIVLQNLVGVPLRAGSRVLVNGAAGGVGTIAMQVAKARGAEVTGVELPDRLELARAAGADRVLDGARGDYTAGEGGYDLVFDVPGNRPWPAPRRLLAPRGVYVWIGHDGYGAWSGELLGSVPRALGLVARSLVDRNLARPARAPPKRRMLEELAALAAAGKLAPVVDRTCSLAEVPAALADLESGRLRGRVVVTPGSA